MSENKSAKELNTALKELWNGLTEEQKEKAKQCQSMDELTVLAGKFGVELPDEMLDAVAGGGYVRSEFYQGRPPKETFEEYRARKEREKQDAAESSC